MGKRVFFTGRQHVKPLTLLGNTAQGWAPFQRQGNVLGEKAEDTGMRWERVLMLGSQP